MERIVSSLSLSNELKCMLATTISEASIKEPALLQRTYTEVKQDLDNGDAYVVVTSEFTGDKVIGHACLRKLSNNFAEIGTAWISPAFRGRGIYSRLKKYVLKQANKQGLSLIGTIKPSPENGLSTLFSSVALDILPVSFSYLKHTDVEAFKKCCACGPNNNYESCPLRDKSCILTVHARCDEVKIASRQFCSSATERSQFLNESLKVLYLESA
ncbi:GNAT family N-acetyltransferase [Pseudoalteromonas sp. JBTF-M23]|uniref:GNAT family N-acetyltransferase n=1 Tax=Pseudoalteromonas caenipelagi TaxID=2726988 RepID=A0A849VCB4_9GAMM|nr:GNAT family N-acetyltransferase [Pseudoalteromonas caenipelagi]NOU51309.1 GNAT family N-acetyltransferase [Pseudoalteromonas caenipelagi]